MGGSISQLQIEEVDELRKKYPQYTQSDIRRLYKRFTEIDRGNKGFLTPSDLIALPELAMNPCQERLLALLPMDEGRMNFCLFCAGLAPFHPLAPAAAKLEFLFRFYDVDGDGFVSVSDVESILRMSAGADAGADSKRALGDEEIKELARGALGGRDKIDSEGFAVLCGPEEAIMRKLQFPFRTQPTESEFFD